MNAFQVASADTTRQRFVALFNKIHGSKSGEMIYENELYHFTKKVQENQDLQKCTRLSLYGAFLDVAVQGLSFDPNKKLAYLIPENVNLGTKDDPKWEKRAAMKISPYGELALRQQCGQIKYADDPVIVYEGDFFEVAIQGGSKVVNYKSSLPRKSNKIIAGFLRIVKNDDSVDFFVIDQPGIDRLKGYSERKNRGQANALYSSCNGGIDPGFFGAKLIKHAFQSYPKVKLKGQFSKLESEKDEPIDYGISTPNNAQPQLTEVQPSAAASAVISAMTADENQQGHVVNIDNDGDPFGN